jgi:PHD/YefM family antitoxin component YafN of YafNO toxin-antitoxin module
MNIITALENTVSISLFNRGLAGKIFSEVKHTGAKVVMKNNTPECVLLSPEEYIKLMDEINDAKLLQLAIQRIENYNPNDNLSAEKVKQELGITDEELSSMDEVEFE